MKPQRRTVLDALLDPKNLELYGKQPSVRTIRDEAMAIVGAGTDTVANAMVMATCHVLENPYMHSRLKEELRAAYPDPNTEMKWTDLEKLPYLTGVIKEGLRYVIECSLFFQDNGLIFQDYPTASSAAYHAR